MVIHQFNRIIRNKWIWGVFAIAISAFFAFDFLLTGGIGTVTELTLTGLISAVKQKAGDVSEDEIKRVVDALKVDDTKRAEIKNFRKTFKEVFEEWDSSKEGENPNDDDGPDDTDTSADDETEEP